MLISGKISVGVLIHATAPRNRIRAATTEKVCGKRSAKRTMPMARPHAFQRRADGTICRGVPRLHTERNEIRARLLLDMVRHPLAKDFATALPAVSSGILFIGGCTECSVRRLAYRVPVKATDVRLHVSTHSPCRVARSNQKGVAAKRVRNASAV